MKNSILILIGFLFFQQAFSQNKAIRIVNNETQKETIIKEHKRIRLKTIDSNKISGKFSIIDNENILIRSKTINLNDIEKIKRNPLLMTIVVDGLLIYAGAAMVVLPLFLTLLSGDTLAIFFWGVPGAGLIYSGIKSPNPLKGYKTSQYTYKIINL